MLARMYYGLYRVQISLSKMRSVDKIPTTASREMALFTPVAPV
jgi:hypothetical protein